MVTVAFVLLCLSSFFCEGAHDVRDNSSFDVNLHSRETSSAPHFETYHFRGDLLRLMPVAGAFSAGRVIVEVGINKLASYFAQLFEDESLVVVGLEPNPATGVWHPKHPRFVLLPLAAADVGYESGASPAKSKFHVTPYSECSSLLQPRQLKEHPAWLERCTASFVEVEVPVMPLEPILARAATYGPVKLLDVDAQGSELSIVASAGAGMAKFVD